MTVSHLESVDGGEEVGVLGDGVSPLETSLLGRGDEEEDESDEDREARDQGAETCLMRRELNPRDENDRPNDEKDYNACPQTHHE